MRIFAQNFRGFKFVDLSISGFSFLVGDNSSGKTSILHLINSIANSDLNEIPKLDEDFGVGRYDYFSPYFDYADVTFGFYDNSSENFVGKILTVRQTKTGIPKEVLCSHFAEGSILTFKNTKAGAKFRYRSFECPGNINSIIDIHCLDFGFKKFDAHRGLQISHPTAIFMVDDGLLSKSFKDAVLDIDVPSARLISPTRALPEKFYSFSRKYHVHGKHFASMWMDIFSAQSKKYFEKIDEFGVGSGLFDSVNVKTISNKIKESPMLVNVKKNGKSFLLHQLGIGVAQIIPVLVESAYVQLSTVLSYVLLVQQPELHLHPIAQAELGSYFFNTANGGMACILETHSSYLIDRFRSDYRDQYLENPESCFKNGEKPKILFCQNSENGNSITEVSIDKDGHMRGEPDAYHQFFIEEFTRTML